MMVRLIAAAILACEALGLAVLLVWQVVAMMSGDTASLASAIALAALTLVGAVAVAAFSVATARGQSWGRSGGIVAQALILAVALGELTGENANPATAALIAAPALVCGVMLILTVRAAGRQARAGEQP